MAKSFVSKLLNSPFRKVVLCVHCFYQYFIIACLWLDHPYVCTVRGFSMERCIVSLELDRAGLGYRISGHGVR